MPLISVCLSFSSFSNASDSVLFVAGADSTFDLDFPIMPSNLRPIVPSTISPFLIANLTSPLKPCIVPSNTLPVVETLVTSTLTILFPIFIFIVSPISNSPTRLYETIPEPSPPPKVPSCPFLYT